MAHGFQRESLDESTVRGLEHAAAVGEQIVDDAYENSAEKVDGWHYTMADGWAGYDFALRAALAKYILGGNVAEDLLYPNCRVDEDGDALSGENAYVLRFDKGAIPTVSVFWNLAMYDEGELFIENSINRYSIGSTTDGLVPGA